MLWSGVGDNWSRSEVKVIESLGFELDICFCKYTKCVVEVGEKVGTPELLLSFASPDNGMVLSLLKVLIAIAIVIAIAIWRYITTL